MSIGMSNTVEKSTPLNFRYTTQEGNALIVNDVWITTQMTPMTTLATSLSSTKEASVTVDNLATESDRAGQLLASQSKSVSRSMPQLASMTGTASALTSSLSPVTAGESVSSVTQARSASSAASDALQTSSPAPTPSYLAVIDLPADIMNLPLEQQEHGVPILLKIHEDIPWNSSSSARVGTAGTAVSRTFSASATGTAASRTGFPRASGTGASGTGFARASGTSGIGWLTPQLTHSPIAMFSSSAATWTASVVSVGIALLSTAFYLYVA